jgi:hypothetical protein
VCLQPWLRVTACLSSDSTSKSVSSPSPALLRWESQQDWMWSGTNGALIEIDRVLLHLMGIFFLFINFQFHLFCCAGDWSQSLTRARCALYTDLPQDLVIQYSLNFTATFSTVGVTESLKWWECLTQAAKNKKKFKKSYDKTGSQSWVQGLGLFIYLFIYLFIFIITQLYMFIFWGCSWI